MATNVAKALLTVKMSEHKKILFAALEL